MTDANELAELNDTVKDDLYIPHSVQKSSNALIKRTHLRSLIYELYDLREAESTASSPQSAVQILAEGVMEKLPAGKTLKNSALLAWKKRYIQLSSVGVLSVFAMSGNVAEIGGAPIDRDG